MRRRSLIEWDDQRDRELLGELARFKARARGRRLKDLALLGLLAERSGCRVVSEGVGGVRLEGVAAPLVVVGGVTDPTPTASIARNDAPLLSSEHEAGLAELLGNVVGF